MPQADTARWDPPVPLPPGVTWPPWPYHSQPTSPTTYKCQAGTLRQHVPARRPFATTAPLWVSGLQHGSRK
eukprot:53809-Eustigmatos_ZCMA.PRE.1